MATNNWPKPTHARLGKWATRAAIPGAGGIEPIRAPE